MSDDRAGTGFGTHPAKPGAAGLPQQYQSGSHQMVIIAHRGDLLELYNPWGATVWVSESDFVDNHMQGASDDRFPAVSSVRMPE
ncbi:hypothetical protein [Kitasatospora sp. NPDC085464]|uniref:hypothetical protein n=1 Tax=Kitasatospora sp. NPDC085464 TaxID=3364063 RepID=UPI0037C87062